MAKELLQEAVSGSKFAVEAVQHSATAHITFQKVCHLHTHVAFEHCA